jgi:tRNA threonylcarbamoyladenosine biosynthesis protein TsaB
VTPSARGIVALAEQAFNAEKFEDIAYFEPFYLKEFLVIPSKKKLL